ncbi:hypothetical protein [Homoserinibacter sp. YIM 151385]|uniref:hypothetical protein n=1 Tax=Homoserinibacter sp. YIM 151385 TaxID=2985506 RepID=UPI0022F0491E|nr:hypothetical protein [Homoserinibacter sp. YIM 151385]WBU37523.1 hypothetical protein OF852_11445 [Homoserinibacter sp. YIM 151385]
MLMTGFRDRAGSPAARLVSVLSTAGFAIAGGSGAAFLLTLVSLVIAEEARPDVAAALDAAGRAGIGITSVAIIAGIAIGCVLRGPAGVLRTRQLVRAAAEEPERPAPAADRALLERDAHPFGMFVGFSIFWLSIGGLALLLMLLALGEGAGSAVEPNAEDVPFLIATAVLGGLLAADVVGLIVLRRVVAAWREEAARARWEPAARTRAAAADVARRPPERARTPRPVERALGLVADWSRRLCGVLLGLGGAVFILGVFIRQPGRFAERREFDETGDAGLAIIQTAAAVLLGSGLVLLVIWVLSALAADSARVRAQLAHADAGTASPEYAEMRAALHADAPMLRVAHILLGLGGGAAPLLLLLPVFAEVDSLGLPGWAAPASLAGFALGLVLLWITHDRTAAIRTRLRAGWAPGDIDPPAPAKTTRRRRTRIPASLSIL